MICKKNKSKKSFNSFKTLSYISLGIAIGILIAPSKGETIRSKIIYRFRFLGDKLAEFFLKIFSNEKHIVNTAKIQGDKIISESEEKARQVLEEIESIK